MPRHLNQNSKTGSSGRVQRQFKFKTTSTSRSSSRQLQPSSKNIQQTCYVMILSCRGISYGIAIFLMTPWQLHHWIIVVPSFKSLTTRSNQVQQVARTFQKQSSENCQQVELQNHDNCENCCIHRPMSPHVSNCTQVTSN